MIVTLQTQAIRTLAQVRAFVEGNEPVAFTLTDRTTACAWMGDCLKQFDYPRLRRADKGLLRRYLAKVTGRSRAQITRAITQFTTSGRIEDRRRAPVAPFARRYGPDDIRLLAELDALHGTLSGSTTRKLAERAFAVHGDARYQRLAGISNGHLYNLRASTAYRTTRGSFDKTRATQIRIGERKKPVPDGRCGYLRIDSVHQGDLDGIKGVYLINAVDEVTQFQAVCAVQRISEAFLLPALESLINTFPFVIHGFHSDNGSEYINHRVAKLLDKLRIEQTKSRSRQTNDNALAESKNASTVRKHLGYSHIPQRFASRVNAFTCDLLTPYLNFHRPCHFPSETINAKGKVRKHYRYADMMTPFEKLASLPNVAAFLKPGITLQTLHDTAVKQSDNDAARELNQARTTLFQFINKSQAKAA